MAGEFRRDFLYGHAQLGLGFRGCRSPFLFFDLSDLNLEFLFSSLANDLDRDLFPHRCGCYDIGQLAHLFDLFSVKGNDDISTFNTCLLSRSAVHDIRYQGPLLIFEAQFFLKFFVDLLNHDAQPAPDHLSFFELWEQIFDHIDGNGKTDPHAPAGP